MYVGIGAWIKSHDSASFSFDSGYEELAMNPSDVFTAAEFGYAQAAVGILMSGLEKLQNA